MTGSLDPLPERARALLELDRADQVPPKAASQRMWAAIATQMPAAPQGSVPRSPLRLLKTPLRPLTLGHAVALGTVVFGIGAAVGHLAIRAPRPAMVTPASALQVANEPPKAPAPVVAAPAANATTQPAPTPAPLVKQTPARMAARTPARAPSVSPGPSLAPAALAPLPPERASIAAALQALQRSDPQGALDALREHAEVYPNGQLAEEREALRVRALVALDRPDEAEAVAKSFDQRFPNSLLAPVVRATLAAPAP